MTLSVPLSSRTPKKWLKPTIIYVIWIWKQNKDYLSWLQVTNKNERERLQVTTTYLIKILWTANCRACWKCYAWHRSQTLIQKSIGKWENDHRITIIYTNYIVYILYLNKLPKKILLANFVAAHSEQSKSTAYLNKDMI